jgi:hypothetical protein
VAVVVVVVVVVVVAAAAAATAIGLVMHTSLKTSCEKIETMTVKYVLRPIYILFWRNIFPFRPHHAN